ncbi:unnamed protein product [Closterium sp. NIES-65]|nr:unnamed protein product [Closterium sp. NIES-65]
MSAFRALRPGVFAVFAVAILFPLFLSDPSVPFSLAPLAAQAASSKPWMGENLGVGLSSNPVSLTRAVSIIKQRGFSAVKLFQPDPTALNALAGSGLEVMTCVPNQLLHNFAKSDSAALAWLDAKIVPYMAKTNILAIAVGNEVISPGNPFLRSVVPAMESLYKALSARKLQQRVKVVTPQHMNFLQNAYLPSSTQVVPSVKDEVTRLLSFLKRTVGETGWPTAGAAVASPAAAKEWNTALVLFLLSGRGTPKRRNSPIRAYLFEMFDEDRKSTAMGKFETSFGLCTMQGEAKYPLNVLGGAASGGYGISGGGTSGGSSKNRGGGGGSGSGGTSLEWCVPKSTATKQALSNAVAWACSGSGGGMNCGALMSKCPDSSKAAVVFNEWYHSVSVSTLLHATFLATTTTKDPPPSSQSCIMASIASLSLTTPVTTATALAASSSAARGNSLNAKSSVPLRCVTPIARPAVRCQAQPTPVASATAAPAAVAALPFRVGHGFDLHRLEPNLPLIIGGVNIPHDRGCDAHSDGDVLLHCVVDAVLGALGLPDIGQLFPDNDPKWKGAASHLFLEEAVRRMHEAGYTVGNLDATVILQRPKLSPHKPTIKANLAALLQAPEEVINVKAKTHEKVDSLGENRSQEEAGSEVWRAAWAVGGWSRRRKKFPREETLRDVKESGREGRDGSRGVANAGMQDTLSFFDGASSQQQLQPHDGSPFSRHSAPSHFRLPSESTSFLWSTGPRPSSTSTSTAAAAGTGTVSGTESTPVVRTRVEPFNGTLQTVSTNGSPFLTEVRVGASKQRFIVLVDTASDLFWLPCNCIQCATQSSVPGVPVQPPYDPALSATSQSNYCFSPACTSFAAEDKTASVGCLVSSALPAPDPLCQYAATYTGPEGGSVGNLLQDALHAAVSKGSSSAANVTFGTRLPTRGPREAGSVGNLLRDALHTAVSKGSSSAANVTFGCGRYQTGFLSGRSAAPNGVFGMGRGALSPLSQLAAQGAMSNAFSLCMEGDPGARVTAFAASAAAAAAGGGSAGADAGGVGVGAGKLLMGVKGVPAGAQSTPIVSSDFEPFYFINVSGMAAGRAGPFLNVLCTFSQPVLPSPLPHSPSPRSSPCRPFYFINVTGMAVGNATLALPRSAFPPLDASGNGGTVLDSSASITVLPTQAYQAMATQYLVAVPGLKYDYTLSDQQGVDCLNASAYAQPTESTFLAQFPTLSLILANGALFTVQPSAYLYLVRADVICFAITPSLNSNQHTIIPDSWLTNRYMVFDNEANKLSWLDTNCEFQPRRGKRGVYVGEGGWTGGFRGTGKGQGSGAGRGTRGGRDVGGEVRGD